MSESDSNSLYEFLDDYKIVLTCLITAGVGIFALKRWFHGGVCTSNAKLNGKTVLITGANTGIGKETARDMARRGARVLIACRDLKKADQAVEEIQESTGNKEIFIYQLDLASLKSVRQCAGDIIEKEPRLDILINNAGVMWVPQGKSEDGFEMHFAVNHLGHFLFTNLLLDLLKKSAPSRIVNVSSLAHIGGKIDFDDVNSDKKKYNINTAYCQSKLANVLFTRELSKRLEGTDVTTNSLHPGVIHTELTRYAVETFPWYNSVLLKPVKYFYKTPVQGAQTTIYCAVSEELEGVSGKYFSDCALKEPASQGKDDEVARKLWTMSEEMVGLKS